MFPDTGHFLTNRSETAERDRSNRGGPHDRKVMMEIEESI